MGKLTIPGANMREQAMFDKLGISLLQSISEESFMAVVTRFLAQHNVLHLASHRQGRIRSTPLEYFSSGITVHVFSEGGGKIANLRACPDVCYSIAEPYDPAAGILGARGMQVWGTATVFKKNEDPQRAAAVFEHYPNKNTITDQGIADDFEAVNFNIITVEPAVIRYLDLKQGFRNVTWKRDG